MSNKFFRPTSDNREEWIFYWVAQGEPWRLEPEISKERQLILLEKIKYIEPNISKGIYTFKGSHLTRGDIEWLLSNHESGGIRGPIDWDDKLQRKRKGLDLRGADMSSENLSGLPLARLYGGLSGQEMDEWYDNESIVKEAAINLSNANLRYTRFEGSSLTYANLSGTDLSSAHFESADLHKASLTSETPIDLRYAHFNSETTLRYILFSTGIKSGAPRLVDVHWNGANLSNIGFTALQLLGDEQIANQKNMLVGEKMVN
ncbi:MAG: pentapeptide repeat-containing protein [Ktedonobacteraceae bacterium]|nr:pentapeptide repeat-containing protein [Ktedonobacteraceae bacterium]